MRKTIAHIRSLRAIKFEFTPPSVPEENRVRGGVQSPARVISFDHSPLSSIILESSTKIHWSIVIIYLAKSVQNKQFGERGLPDQRHIDRGEITL
jgi:hypothetical protein